MIANSPFATSFGQVKQQVVIPTPKPEDFSFCENLYLDELCDILERGGEAAFNAFSSLVDKVSSWV